nr:flagellin [Alicyclobacillus mali (ex Roth et al. 2021)]
MMEQQQFLYNLENINTSMQNVQEELSTGKTLNLPQNDPVAVSQDMNLAAEVSEINAGLSTVSSGLSWMNTTSTALQGMISQLQEIQSNVVEALNSTSQSGGSLAGIEASVNQLIEGIYQIADQKIGDRYIFGGQAWNVAPSSYTQQSGTQPIGASSDVSYEITSGVSISVTVTASSIFLTPPSGAKDLQTTLNDIENDLQSGNMSALSSDLNDLNQNLSNVINLNADLGARIQRMTAAQNQMQQYQTNLSNLKGGIEGADMAQVITQFSTDQVIYEAALQMGAQILLPSLVNYLPN